MTGKKAKAHHEAGHAVVARMLGVTVDHASLFVGANVGVLTESAFHQAKTKPPSEQIAAAEIDAKVAFAGPLAQVRYRPLTEGQKRKAQEHGGWRDDMASLKSLVAQMIHLQQGGEIVSEGQTETLNIDANAFDAAWFRLNSEAQNLVDQNWAAIHRVARALLLRDILYQDDIDALMRERTEVENRCG